EVERAWQLRRPAQGQRAAVLQVHRHRAPAGFGDLQLDRIATLDLDPLADPARRRLALGYAVAQTVLVQPVHAVEIGPVAVAVGEAPGDVAVAADDHRRDAGQGEAGDVDAAIRRPRVGVAQAGTEPQRRRPQSQVHVV